VYMGGSFTGYELYCVVSYCDDPGVPASPACKAVSALARPAHGRVPCGLKAYPCRGRSGIALRDDACAGRSWLRWGSCGRCGRSEGFWDT